MENGFFQEISAQLWLVFAVFLRIAPALALAPGYGERYVSVRLRLAAAGMFAIMIAPVLQPHLPDDPPKGAALLLFASREITMGFFLGIMSRGVLFLLEKTGAVISQSASLAQMFGNATDPMPVIGHILTSAGLAVLFSTTLADQMLFAFVASYGLDISSVASLPGYFGEKINQLMNFVFKNAVVLASGFLGLIMIYNLCIGFINKAMPQFMVSFIGIPFVALLSIFFLYQNFELVLDVWQEKALVILMMPYEATR